MKTLYLKFMIGLLMIIVIPSLAEGGEEMFKIASVEFAHNTDIPSAFTCQGEDVNPSLTIERIPEGTTSLALIVDDPDAPGGMWVHWVVFNIPPTVKTIEENSIPGLQGKNDFGKKDYGGPCPPSGKHRYFFKIYALDQMLDIKEGISKTKLEESMKGHILGKAELIGLYKKH